MRKFMVVAIAFLLLFGAWDTQAQIGNRIWIPYTDFHRVTNTGVSMASTADVGEISSFGIGGFPMDTADLVSMYLPFPADKINTRYPLGVRIWYASVSSGDDGGIDWLFDIEEKAITLIPTALETATTALADGIAFAADSSTIQYAVNITDCDTIGVAALSTYNSETLVELSIELNDRGDASADELHFLGVELIGVPLDFQQSNFYIPGATQHQSDKGLTIPRKP